MDRKEFEVKKGQDITQVHTEIIRQGYEVSPNETFYRTDGALIYVAYKNY